jgi:hypothetical protein
MERNEVLVLQKAWNSELHLPYKPGCMRAQLAALHQSRKIGEIKIKSVKFFQLGDGR